MSEKVETEEKTLGSNNVHSLTASTNTIESAKIIDEKDKELNLNDCSEQSADDGNTMDVTEESKNGCIEEPNRNVSVEMEAITSESALNKQKQLTNDDLAKPSFDTVISNDSVCIDIVDTNDSTETSDEAQKQCTKSNAVTGDFEVNQQKSPAVTASIGSLGLLNQYVSSSDEDEDSSESSDDSDESETETETDTESDDSSVINNNVEALDAPITTVTENQLNTMANNILASALSRNNYRDVSSDTSETDSDDSDIECIGSVSTPSIDITNDDEIQEFLDTCEATTPSGPVKAKGEFTIDDLPPIDELTITVPESECVELGKVSGIVGTLVLVESLPNFAAVDIDTVLFLDKGNRTLGQVFDVMGNVAAPIYCVRFNAVQDITAKDIKTGLTVYVAPQTEYTNFIVLSDLMKQKGCDASWENDHEAPDGLEFSDDEEERLARRMHNQRQHNRSRTTSTTSNDNVPNKVVKSEPDSAQKSYSNSGRRSKFDQRMAKANKPPTRFYKDNRGYANVNPESNLYQHQQQFQHPNHFHHRHQQQQMHMQQQQQQQMQAMHQNYSWHTAAAAAAAAAAGMHTAMPPMPSTSINPYPTANGTNIINSTLYPNPFALQANALNYGPFNLQAFPPLPPPISSLPPPPLSAQQQQQHHQHNHQPSTSGRFNRKNGKNPYQSY